MENTDSAPITASSRAQHPFWHTGALLLILAVLLASSLTSLRGERSQRSDDSARLFLDTTLQARQVYAMRRMGAYNPVLQGRLLANLKRLADLQPAAQAIRRLAIMQYVLGDPGWKESLLRLRTLPLNTSPFQTERELTMWRLALENRPNPTQVDRLSAQIKRLDLAWYEHLALEALYRNAGMREAARREADAALQTWVRLILLGLLGLGTGLVGLAMGTGALGYILWRRRNPQVPAPRGLEIDPPAPLSHTRADALYTIFLSFLATRAALQIGLPLILRSLLGPGTVRVSVVVDLLLSITLLFVSLAVPFVVYRRLKPIVGLTAADIGLRSRRPWADIVWGIGGYTIAIPLLMATIAFSSWLFRGIETPLNPAITEFAGTRSALVQALIFTQAVVMAPLVEETLFRGIFFRALTPRAGRIGALLIASAVFALLHPQLPLGFLGIFVLGALFNTLYLLRGSLIPSMVAHAINNGAILLFVMLILGD